MKGYTVNIFSFVGHVVSVASTQSVVVSKYTCTQMSKTVSPQNFIYKNGGLQALGCSMLMCSLVNIEINIFLKIIEEEEKVRCWVLTALKNYFKNSW